MPKNSGQQGNRSLGLNHGAGKGDKTRVTDVKAYRANFDEIDWGPRVALRPNTRMVPIIFDKPLKTLRELEEEFAWRHGL